MTAVFGIFLLTLLVITALAIVRTRNLFVAVMLTGIFSVLLALNFFLLDAADVALTEAAIGAGISNVLFLGALALTAEREARGSGNRLAALVVVVAAALIVIYATFDKPRFGDPLAPAQVHVAPWYIEKTPEHIDIPNVVTAVLGSYRAYDTLGEVFVVFAAGIGVLFLLGARHQGASSAVPDPGDDGLHQHLALRVVGLLLIPFILLFGLYLQFHGEYSPGGGFQAGAIVAAALILYALLDGEEAALRVLPRGALRGLVAGGTFLFCAVGVAAMLAGGNFLDYSVLMSNPVKGQQIGILLIEVGVGLTVTGVMLSIFLAFATRHRA